MTKVRGLTQKPWRRVLSKTIAVPAALQGIKDKETELREGMKADMTVFRIKKVNSYIRIPGRKAEPSAGRQQLSAPAQAQKYIHAETERPNDHLTAGSAAEKQKGDIYLLLAVSAGYSAVSSLCL